jgi:MFS family permease
MQKTSKRYRRDTIFIGALFGLLLGALFSAFLVNLYHVQDFAMPLIISSGLGMLVGVWLSNSWLKLPDDIRSKFRARVERILGEGIAYLWIGLISLVIFGTVGYSASKWIVSLSNDNLELQEYIGIITGVIVTVLAFLSQRPKISKDLLVKQLDIEELKASQRTDVQEFLAKLKPGDEIWLWCTPKWTWDALVGREGYVIVHNGKPTRNIVVTGMN